MLFVYVVYYPARYIQYDYYIMNSKFISAKVFTHFPKTEMKPSSKCLMMFNTRIFDVEEDNYETEKEIIYIYKNCH